MLMLGMLHHLLLTGTCLCVYGAPLNLPHFSPTHAGSCEGLCASSVTTTGSTHATDLKPTPSDSRHESDLTVNVGGGGGTGPHERPRGTDAVTQTENGDSIDGRSRLSEAGGEAWSQSAEIEKIGSKSEMRDSEKQSESVDSESKKEDAPVHGEHLIPTGGTEQSDMDTSTRKRTPSRLLTSTSAPSHLQTSYSQKSNPAGAYGTKSFDSHWDKDTERSLPEPPNPSVSLWTQTSHSPTPHVFTHQTSSPLGIWGHDSTTMSSLPDPFLPEIGPSLIPREDGPESLWTEAARPGGAETALPMPQDESTEATMSSEALPLIFEPFEDITSESATAAAAAVTHVSGSSRPRGLPRSEAGLDQLVTVESDRDGPSHASPVLIPDWTSPWQTSGSELLEPFSSSGPSASQQQVRTEPDDHSEKANVVSARTLNLEDNVSSAGPSLSSFQQAMTMVTMTTHQPAHKSTSEEMDSEEDLEDDFENSEESVEEDSEEDQTETSKTSSTQPPYSLIPPPPVWVQRNQGLMRSWVELIREKAGYVSGMLAPVGIGITGALLIVGALYSIRMIHRKRRNSFKHQRRKQPREPGTSRQDQAMLLADSSEDEF
ncbi:armadillo-like helical domain-containing protein 4 isoform X2 [Simochromis diagramma]|uniref:armadillo-like helical domain-containing protein 4 isoform X2 n=1 Tax=Simochromis diagramma TaxID=43689 RepID=UPI001A7EE75A|nr:armadillo-like helical domain-containing protein 4 isoform X2 [Simochromis diagramma]